MLSVLIPTYNYNCLSIVGELKKQCDQLAISYEIIVQDDASKSELNLENNKINNLENCSFYSNIENLGRGKNRNSLAQKSKYDWLLLIDCDVFPKNKDFIHKYITEIEMSNFDVVYGGICYKDEKPSDEEMLRWIYGRARESITVEARKKEPYKTALTSNLLINRKVFIDILFNENLNKYGYEDLLFVRDLKEKSIPIHHIENEGYHLNLETSKIYLEKIKIALENLKNIYQSDPNLKDESKIIVAHKLLKKLCMTKVISIFFNQIKTKLEHHLQSKNPKLIVLDVYKLGYFCKINLK